MEGKPRTRNLSETETAAEDIKRPKPERSESPGMAASPPTFVHMDQIVQVAKEAADKLHLAHEIAANPDFLLEKNDPPAGSVWAAVKQNMMKAYWDIIQEDMEKDPPVLDMVIKLCENIRDMLLELVLPHQNSLRQSINEVFDIELIKQRCEVEASIEPLKEYAPPLLNLMQRLCCPVRDETIEELRKTEDTITLFKGIVTLLEAMKLDHVNFLIQQIRPVVQSNLSTYEKTQFEKLEEAQKVVGVEDPMRNTRAWLKRAYDHLYSVSQEKPPLGMVPIQAYFQLIFQTQYINEEWEIPETLLVDKQRIIDLQQQSLLITIGSTILLIAQGYIPAPLNADQTFKQKLKHACIIVLKEIQCNDESELREALNDLGSKIFFDIQDETNGVLTAQHEATFRGQILEVVNADHPVRNVVFDRVLMFVSEMVKTGAKTSVKIPPGLSAFETDLTKFAATFLQLISFNRSTYIERYTSIITDIADTKRDS